MKTPNFINVIIEKTGSNAKSNGLSASRPVFFALIFSSCSSSDEVCDSMRARTA